MTNGSTNHPWRLVGWSAQQAGDTGDGFAVGVWSAVLVVWLLTWVYNLFWHGTGALPDIPAGVAGVLAALPVSKAVAELRKR
jgi:hypothetical protein